MKRTSKLEFESIKSFIRKKHEDNPLPFINNKSSQNKIRSKKRPQNTTNELMSVFCRIKQSKKMFFLENEIDGKSNYQSDLEKIHKNNDVKKLEKYINGYSKKKNPIILMDSNKHSMIFKKNSSTKKKSSQNVIYKFDGIVSPFKSQKEMFQMIAQPTLAKLFCNKIDTGMIFAYGYTNSGKTYSVIGDTNYIAKDRDSNVFFGRSSIGLLPRILRVLIEKRKQDLEVSPREEWISDIELSAFEIYKEKVYDLFISTGSNKNLQNMGQQANEITNKHGKPNFKKKRILNKNDVLNALKFSENTRTIGDNGINSKSSRSHAVYKINFVFTSVSNSEKNVSSNLKKIEEENVKNSQNIIALNNIKSTKKEIFIIDLAGAEKPNVEHMEGNGFNLLHQSQIINQKAGKKSVQTKANFYIDDLKKSGVKSVSKARFHSQIRRPALKPILNLFSLKSKKFDFFL